MRKNFIVPIVALLFLLGVGSGVYFYSLQKKIGSEVSPQAGPSEKLNEYTDGSGFTFRYPDDITIQANPGSDSSVYADLVFSSAQLPDSISLKVIETKLESIDEWAREKSQGVTSDTKKIKLADMSGYEIKAKTGLLTGVLDQGILFTIDVDSQDYKDFWQKVYDTLLSTFAFSEIPSGSDSSVGTTEEESSGDIIFEGEEVIE